MHGIWPAGALHLARFGTLYLTMFTPHLLSHSDSFCLPFFLLYQVFHLLPHYHLSFRKGLGQRHTTTRSLSVSLSCLHAAKSKSRPEPAPHPLSLSLLMSCSLASGEASCTARNPLAQGTQLPIGLASIQGFPLSLSVSECDWTEGHVHGAPEPVAGRHIPRTRPHFI